MGHNTEALFTRGISPDLDLMAFPCTEDHEHLFGGSVARIVAFARDRLVGCSDENVREVMALADAALSDLVCKKLLVDADGRPFSLDEVRKGSTIEFLPPTCMQLSAAYELMAKKANESSGADFSAAETATPAHVCLALALGHAVTAISRMDTPGFFQVGAWHAMVAAEVMGVCYLQMNDLNYQGYLSRRGARASARSRWSRLDPVKAMAFQRREELAHLSRSAAIDRMLPEILAAAKAAGVPLTGANRKATIEGWFRDAGIK